MADDETPTSDWMTNVLQRVAGVNLRISASFASDWCACGSTCVAEEQKATQLVGFYSVTRLITSRQVQPNHNANNLAFEIPRRSSRVLAYNSYRSWLTCKDGLVIIIVPPRYRFSSTVVHS